MLVKFFFSLRQAGVPVSMTEFLTLLDALRLGLGGAGDEQFYHLARTCLVKDERHYDRFDRAFGAYFRGLGQGFELAARELPADWLTRLAEGSLSDVEKAQVAAQGGWAALMETLAQRLREQRERHEGGNRWIGTAGTSPFGAHGYHPSGVRIGQEAGRNRSAVKVWDRRDFADFDEDLELGTRNLKLALRRLRRFARRGAPAEFALEPTIEATARSGGWLDIRMVAPRRNVVKVLPLPEDEFVAASILPCADGEAWHQRFLAVKARLPATPRVMNEAVGPGPAGANPYQRFNQWLLCTARGRGDDRLGCVFVWDGGLGDGPGGTRDLVERARRHAVRMRWIDLRRLEPPQA